MADADTELIYLMKGRGPFGVKLTNANDCTRENTRWGLRMRHAKPLSARERPTLCTNTVFHYYPFSGRRLTSHHVNAFLARDPYHGGYTTNRFHVWIVRPGRRRVSDGQKAGATTLTTLFRINPSTLKRI